MPKEKPFENKIESLYKKSSIDLMMFAWVSAITKILPAVRQVKAIEMFQEWMGLSEDDYPAECAKVTYSRIKQDFNWRTKK